jgi:hypothetical protein
LAESERNGRDNVVEMYCTLISWNYGRGTEEDNEVSRLV